MFSLVPFQKRFCQTRLVSQTSFCARHNKLSQVTTWMIFFFCIWYCFIPGYLSPNANPRWLEKDWFARQMFWSWGHYSSKTKYGSSNKNQANQTCLCTHTCFSKIINTIVLWRGYLWWYLKLVKWEEDFSKGF